LIRLLAALIMRKLRHNLAHIGVPIRLRRTLHLRCGRLRLVRKQRRKTGEVAQLRHLRLGGSAVAWSLHGAGDLREETGNVCVEVVGRLRVLLDIVAGHGAKKLGEAGGVERSDEVGYVGLLGGRRLREGVGHWLIERGHVAVEAEVWCRWLDRLRLGLFSIVDEESGCCRVKIGVIYPRSAREVYNVRLTYR
jgi:hypothetical protein